MTRVSENSSFHAINYSVGKTKSRLENLQLQGSNLKRINKPSDDPVGNIEILAARSQQVDRGQYLRNGSYAKTQLIFTENAIEELTDIVMKAKELAIGQSSNLFGPESRYGVAKEVAQLRYQAIGIGNRRLNNRYIFAGYKSLTTPFTQEGEYKGDSNRTTVEISKDFFIPVNFSGKEIFYSSNDTSERSVEKFHDINLFNKNLSEPEQVQEDVANPFLAANGEDNSRSPATEGSMQVSPQDPTQSSLFSDLGSLEAALLSGNHEIIQSLLPRLDDHLNRLIQTRTEVGSIVNSIENAEMSIEKNKLITEEYRSKIEDADIAELFTDLTRQKNVLDATYKSSAQLMNQSLLNFIK